MARIYFLSKKNKEIKGMIPIFCPAYFPNVNYFVNLLQQKSIVFAGNTFYKKQSFRSRTVIYGANKELKLIIPIRHWKKGKKPIDSKIKIAYDMDWQNQHWKSICSAYRSSPYFEFYEHEIAPFYKEEKENLFLFNLSIIEKVMALMDESFEYKISSLKGKKYIDKLIDPKIKSKNKFEAYPQVFSSKYGFIPNLSILDIIFNLGPNSSNYLRRHFTKK